MNKFELIAYEKENGEVPVEDFLDSLNVKGQEKGLPRKDETR